MPQFSIVMPTRNRGNILRYAVQSALEQEFDDFEVIVSNNDSSDDTRALIQAIDHPRLRYVETGRMLPMPESWEFAAEHARGDFLTVLCDDDALAPRCCERVARHLDRQPAEVIYWPRFHYTFSDWYDEELRNSLQLRNTSGRATLEPTEPMLRKWFETCAYHVDAPMLLNGFVRRTLMEKVRANAGRFFSPPAPDVGSSVSMLSHCDQMLRIDDAMGIVGTGRQSIGSDQVFRSAGGVAREFEAEFRGDIFTRVPFKVNMIATTVTDTLATAKELMPDALADYEICWEEFYISCYRELEARKEGGWNVDAAMEELMRQIREVYPHLSERLAREDELRLRKAARRRRKQRIHRARAMLGFPKKRKAAKKAGNPMSDAKVRIYGEDGGFRDILECVRRLDDLSANIDAGRATASPSSAGSPCP
jgi:glycosyltransferase involved in cell wall biosynthesis